MLPRGDVLTRHTTTVWGKDLNITRNDILKIAKSQGIKTSTAVKIIDKCVEVLKTFEEKAAKLELDINTLQSCKNDINNRIKLLFMA